MPKLSDGYAEAKRTNKNWTQSFNCYHSYPKSHRLQINGRINQISAVGTAELREFLLYLWDEPKLTVVLCFTSERAH